MEVGDKGGIYVPLATYDSDEKRDNSLEEHDHDEDEEVDVVHSHDSIFAFVEASWFQIVATCIILFNTVAVFLEADDKRWKKKLFFADQVTLCFYIFELFCRMCFFGSSFLCGRLKVLIWNVLDLLVVFAGVIDQWVLPFSPVDKDSPLFSVILMFRLLRLVRVMKIVRVLLETDLSWTELPRFQSFIGGVIAFNALLMGFETDIKWEGWSYIEQVLLIIYVFELLVRLKRFGLFFLSWHNGDFTWNLLDFCIVVSSAADSWLIPCVKIIGKQFSNGDGGNQKQGKGLPLSQVMMLMRMLRLMRILRLVKLVKSVRPLYILVTGVVAAFQGVFWVLVLTVVTLYAAGILSTRLLGHGLLFPHGAAPKEAVIFKSVSDSMFTLFRVMSGAQSDDEAYAIDQLMRALPSAKFAFIFFMVTSSWTLLSILTAVVSDTMLCTTGEQDAEEKIASDEEDRAAHRLELRQLFNDINRWNQRGEDETIVEGDIVKFLEEKENSVKTAKICRVATRNVLVVLRTLSPNQAPVEKEEFVESMLDVGKPVTVQSIMKVETLFKDTQRQMNDGCKQLRKHVSELVGNHQKAQLQSKERSSRHENMYNVIRTLIERQKRNNQHIVRLRESIEALLRSQHALRQQNDKQSVLMSKLEEDIKVLEQSTGDELRGLRLRIEELSNASSSQRHARHRTAKEDGFSSSASTASDVSQAVRDRSKHARNSGLSALPLNSIA